MDRFDRIYALHRILAARRTPISLADLQGRLECSTATAKRCIADARDFLNAPIEYDRAGRGYRYAPREDGVAMFELPGLWFNASELFALLVSQRLLAEVAPGLLAPQLAPLQERIGALLAHRRLGHPDIARRIRILPMAARAVDLEQFRMVAGALLQRRRLHILYHGRARDETTERDVSPQRLTYYRSNWYLDAWCHQARGLRSFALDCLHPVYVDEAPAKDVPDNKLDRHYAGAYGIFGGAPDKTAVLRFSAQAARWVVDEQWHPQEQGRVLADGSYELRVPYRNPTELIMDVLKHGPEVEVLGPKSLREALRERIARMAARYPR